MNTWEVHTWPQNSPVANAAVNAGIGSFPLGLSPGPDQGRRSPLDGMVQPSPLQVQSDGSVTEAGVLRVVGRPSISVSRLGNGGAQVTLRRNIASMETLGESDAAFIEAWGETVLSQLQAMSRGPYTLSDLRRLGHPYGFADSPFRGGKTFSPRVVPRRALGKSLASAKGVRGSVPSLSVVNSQSGTFQKSWDFSFERDASGFTLRFKNSAPYAWLLVHGTRRMQAHGPFTYAVLARLGALDSQIRQTIYRVKKRGALERADAQTLQMLIGAGDSALLG